MKIPRPDQIKVVSTEEANEKCEYLICARYPGPFPNEDNVVALCVKCARRVVHRPHAPAKLQPMCSECAGLDAEKGTMPDGTEVYTTYDTVRDVAEWLWKRQK